MDVRIETTLVCEHPPDGLTLHTVTLVVDDEDVGTFSAWVVEIGEVTPEDLDDITAELGRLASVLMLPDGSVNCPGPDDPAGGAVRLLTGSHLSLLTHHVADRGRRGGGLAAAWGVGGWPRVARSTRSPRASDAG